MLDFDADQEEIDLAYNDVLQVIPGDGRSGLNTCTARPRATYLDLLYSNSMWRQSSIPTSILIG